MFRADPPRRTLINTDFLNHKVYTQRSFAQRRQRTQRKIIMSGEGLKCRSVVVTLSLSKSVRRPTHMFRQAQHDNAQNPAAIVSVRAQSRTLYIKRHKKCFAQMNADLFNHKVHKGITRLTKSFSQRRL